MQIRQLDRTIIGCTQCPSGVVNYGWLPISYFGEFDRANAWTISINPSSREFTDTNGIELTGAQQRFSRLADFEDCASRADVASRQAPTVLTMQDSVLRRVPYRNYFNRLGRFVSLVFASKSVDPLQPFVGGTQFRQKNLLFCHLDLVKCATRSPWGQLHVGDQRLLVDNCAPYLREQLSASRDLHYIFINGHTAARELLPIFRAAGLRERRESILLQTTSCELASGKLADGGRPFVVAWTSNVVNQKLSTGDAAALATAVRRLLP
jgi:hypothetical protein